MGIEHSTELRGGKEAGQTAESQCLAARPIPGFYKAFSHPESTHTFPTPDPHSLGAFSEL